MSEFELVVTVLNDEEVVVRAQDGAEAKGVVKVDTLRRDTIAIFEEWLSRGKVSQRRELEVLGRHLYEMVFNGDVGKFFEKNLEEAQKAKQRLVVRLSFGEEAADLADLPWEYLYKPNSYFLSTNVDLVLSRYISLDRGRQGLEPEKSPLRVLIVISSPEDKDLAPVGEADQVIQVIQELAGIQIDRLDKPTIDNFLEKLNEVRPHVLHFIGHGHYNKDKKEAEIALLDDDAKSVRWVRDSEFADYFVHMRWIPRLVLLHLCESTTLVNYDTFTANFARLGRQLVNVNIPAVVAMQHPITNKAAVVFSKYFYRALAKGDSIDAAVQEGRWWISTKVPRAYDDRVFGTPVLYMRSHGGIILPAEESPSTQARQNAEETASIAAKGPRGSAEAQSRSDQNVPKPPTATTTNLPVSTDDQVQLYHSMLVRSIILAGENKMAILPQLSTEKREQITQSLSAIRDQLFAEKKPGEMRNILLRYLSELDQDPDFEAIIWSMIDVVRKML